MHLRKSDWLIIVLVLLALGGWFWHARSTPAAPDTPATPPAGQLETLPSGEVVVTLDDTGFTPSEIRIAVGTTVRFTNTGDEPRWPASDPHPAHTDHPELDPKAGLPPGESWDFVFDAPGTYRMHDHLAALHRATVIVGEETAPAATQPITLDANPCLDSTTDTFNCYERFYTALVLERDIPAALAQIKSEYVTSGYVQSQCHPLMHVIGHAAAKRYPDVGEAFSHGDGFCWSGYYHGVMETVVSTVPRRDIVSRIDSICASVPGKERYGFDYYNCVHGLGHGVMVMTDNELFEALTICDSLTGSWEQSSCYGGVFMENVMVDNRNHKTKYLKASDPLYPCNAVDGKYKNACWLMQTSYMLKTTGGDFAPLFGLCAQADPGYVDTCLHSLGRDASGTTVSDIARTREICLMGPDDHAKTQCIVGAVKDFVSYHHSDREAKALCETLPETIRPACLSTTESYYQSF